MAYKTVIMFPLNSTALNKLSIVAVKIQSYFKNSAFVFSAQEPRHRCLMEDDLEVRHLTKTKVLPKDIY